MAATGVGTAAILATSLVLGATGANDKINAAASKVFGKDTVKIANIAGAMYMAYQAFGSGATGGEALDPGAAGLETAGAAPLDHRSEGPRRTRHRRARQRNDGDLGR